MKIEIFDTKDKQHAVRLKARNGRVLMHSESYKKAAGADHLAILLHKEISEAKQVRVVDKRKKR